MTTVVRPLTVTRVERLSPTFVRVEFAGPGLTRLGAAGPTYDQRVKLIFPPASGQLPDLPDSADWYDQWLQVPENSRGVMRSFTIRDLYGKGRDRRLVIDFVLHLKPGSTGPAAIWANRAVVGDRVIVVGPRRGSVRPGIEFAPGDASPILLAGDESAVPAISRILADLPRHAVGHAFLEVPDRADILPVQAPAGFTVRWMPRAEASVGRQLIPAVLEHFGQSARLTTVDDVGEDHVWETPTYSHTGEELTTVDSTANLYAWIAGESGVVTAIRRHLIFDVGLDRGQVAFMGYWRTGVARLSSRQRGDLRAAATVRRPGGSDFRPIEDSA